MPSTGAFSVFTGGADDPGRENEFFELQLRSESIQSRATTWSGPQSRNSSHGTQAGPNNHDLEPPADELPTLRDCVVFVVEHIVARQSSAIQRAFRLSRPLPETTEYGVLHATIATPAEEWGLIVDPVRELRLELEKHYLVDSVVSLPFQEPATAGFIDSDGYLVERVGEEWTIRYPLPLERPVTHMPHGIGEEK